MLGFYVARNLEVVSQSFLYGTALYIQTIYLITTLLIQAKSNADYACQLPG